MIVCALGYGYLTQFVFKRICALGIKGIGVTSKNINNNEFKNIIFVNRDKIKEVLNYSTHLLITAPPDHKGCSIFNKFSNQILASNIKSLIYISSTGVYGNHRGGWVDEFALGESEPNVCEAERSQLQQAATVQLERPEARRAQS